MRSYRWFWLWAILAMVVVARAADARFTEVIAGSGIHRTNDAGAVVADFDGDGYEDVLFGHSGGNPLSFYINVGGAFSNETYRSGLPTVPYSGRACAGDINGDGRMDLTMIFGNDMVYFENTGLANPVFADMGIIISKYGIAPSLADYDSDGDLDVFAGGHFLSPDGVLMHNDLRETGVVSFRDVTAITGMSVVQGTAHSGITWADADNDRDLDAYFSIDNGRGSGTSRFMRNELSDTGVATFTEYSLAGDLTSGMRSHSGGVVFGDYDHDGDQDVYFGVGFFTSNRFYHNDLAEGLAPGASYPLATPPMSPPHAYREIGGALGVQNPTDGSEARFFDFDNDGDLDLFAGHSGGGAVSLYRNNLMQTGAATFTDVASSQGLGGVSGEKYPLFFDMDQDGDLDILMPGNGRPNRLFRNDNPPQNALEIQLVGVLSATDGSGARVVVEDGLRRQTQEAMSEYRDGWQRTRVHFGLGADPVADTLTVYWPSGIIQELNDVPGGIVTIVENATPTNEAPVATCPAAIVEECDSPDGADVTITVTVADPDGDEMTVSWAVDGVPQAQVANVLDGDVDLHAVMALGSHVVDVIVSDGLDDAVCQTAVTVQDTTAPVVTASLTRQKPTNDDPDSSHAGFLLVAFSAEDACDDDATVGATVCGFAVEPGETIKYTQTRGQKAPKLVMIRAADDGADGAKGRGKDDQAPRMKHVLCADDPVLAVTATDATGNSATEEVEPEPETVPLAAPQSLRGPVTVARLGANYPNPFNPETWIPFALSSDSDVVVTVYNIAGRVVRRLDLGRRPAGAHIGRDRAAYWDGRNAGGETVGSGVYLIELRAGDHREIRRALLTK